MNTADLLIAMPELFILCMACIIMLVDLYISTSRKGIINFISVLTLLVTAMLVMRQGTQADMAIYAFADTFVRDRMGDILKVFSALVLAAILIYAKHYLRMFELQRGEFYVLSLFLFLGCMILISAASLLTVYLGLELVALSSYALVALNRDSRQGSEAAMKYFVLGSLASGLLLYGMSMLYGVTGSLDLSTIANLQGLGNNPILVFGLVFIVIGIAFKLGAVPFHMWVPDVYHGAPALVTMLIGSVPKLAAFAMAIRLLDNGLLGLHDQWMGMLTVLAALSIIIGNLVAIAQTNIKRMLAYSTISHMGFLLLGVLAGSTQGYSASMFYAITYAIVNVGAFAVLIMLSRAGVEAENLDDYKGLNKRSPWFAAVMLMLMFSLAGVPVFVGFFAKWLVIQAVLDAGLLWLAILAVVFSVVGAFYYLRIVKLMYFDEPEVDTPVDAPADFRAMLSVNGLAQLVLGIFANVLIALCVSAF